MGAVGELVVGGEGGMCLELALGRDLEPGSYRLVKEVSTHAEPPAARAPTSTRRSRCPLIRNRADFSGFPD